VSQVVVMLGFDDATDAALRAVWQRLADAGLHHAVDPRHRPHLSVAVVEVDDDGEVVAELDEARRSLVAVPVEWAGLGVFPPTGDGGNGTVHAAPVATAGLIGLQAELYGRLAGAGLDLTGEHPFLVPGRWTPHSTLLTDLDEDGIAAAVVAALPAFPIPSGRVEHLVLAPKARDTEIWSGPLVLA